VRLLACLPAGPCGVVQPWAAFIIGAIGGFVYFVASKVNLNVLKVCSHLPVPAQRSLNVATTRHPGGL
jgi:ammonia channel protein AmtB